MLRIIVNGANGKMGAETVQALQNSHDLELVACCGRYDDLTQTIQDTKAKIVVDFTNALVAEENCRTIINANAHPIIGSSGITPPQAQKLDALAQQRKIKGLIVPNFALGAVFMMYFSRLAAPFFKDVEIIERHHPQKIDKPSGTARETAQQIIASLPQDTGVADIPIHSLRLSGSLAHQSVMFGQEHEVLTITHDTAHRKAFMPGVILACRNLLSMPDGINIGLEQLLLQTIPNKIS